MSKQSTNTTDGRKGGGEGTGDILHPLSAGLQNGRCFLPFGLSMYNSVSPVLGETERQRKSGARAHTHTQKETEMKWLLEATEGSNDIGTA